MLKAIRNERKALEMMATISNAMNEAQTVEGSTEHNKVAKKVLDVIGLDMSKIHGAAVHRPSKKETNNNDYEIQIYFHFNGKLVYMNNYKNHSSGLYFTDKNGVMVSYFDLVKPTQTKNALKELEFFKPGIMKDLNFLFGFDFCKPYEVRKICGNYTINQIKKALGEAAKDSLVICLTTPARWGCRDVSVVEISDKFSGGFNTEIDTRWAKSGVSYFYRKADFNEARKLGTAEAVIVAQRFNNLSKKPNNSGNQYDYRHRELLGDGFERYEVNEVRRSHYSMDKPGSYISELEIKTRTHKGELIKIAPLHEYAPDRVQGLEEIIDKSGYLLQGIRDHRQSAAVAIRKRKEKAAADSADVSEKIAVLEAILTAKKAEIIDELNAATTAAQFDAIADSLDKWRTGSLGWLADYVETFKHRAKTKSFDNPGEIESFYKKIVDAAV